LAERPLQRTDLVVDGERDGDAAAGNDGARVARVADYYVGGADDANDGGGPDMVAARRHLLLAPAGRLVAAAAGGPGRRLLVEAGEAPLHHALPRRGLGGSRVPVLVSDHLVHPILAHRRDLQTVIGPPISK
jgi:hypothetical protein